jgi:putative transposase
MVRSSCPKTCAGGLPTPCAKTLYIEPGSAWDNGHCESSNAKLRDEFLNGETSYSELRCRPSGGAVYQSLAAPH